MAEDVFSEQILPCGRTISNRLVKVAMYEHLASFLGGPPNVYHHALYSAWAEHDWGMTISGNVQVSSNHLTLGRDIILPKTLSEESLSPFIELAKAIHGHGPNQSLAIMQLNHSGRQSSNLIGGRLPFSPPLGPSAVRFGHSGKGSQGLFSEAFHRLLFQTPRAMANSEIEATIDDFVRGAVLASRSGFDGIQLHAAHGYLLAQFLSPKANARTDEYSPESMLLLSRIVTTIRKEVPKDFVLGIKFNTSDYSLSDNSEAKKAQEARAFAHLREVVSWRMIDFIEISGGDYENPEFMMTASSSPPKSRRQAFFADFSSKLMAELSSFSTPNEPLPLILLTGGLRTPSHLHTALSSNHAHLLGIGRGSVLCPHLPTILKYRTDRGDNDKDLTPFSPEPDLLSFTKQWPWSRIWEYVPKVTLIGAGVGMAYYVVMMRRIARARIRRQSSPGEIDQVQKADHGIGGLEAVFEMWAWTDAPELQQIFRSTAALASFMSLIVCLIGVYVFVYHF